MVNNNQKFLFTANAIPLIFGKPSAPIPIPTPRTRDRERETLNEPLERFLFPDDLVGLRATAPGDRGTT